jgi:hypothetical protein
MVLVLEGRDSFLQDWNLYSKIASKSIWVSQGVPYKGVRFFWLELNQAGNRDAGHLTSPERANRSSLKALEARVSAHYSYIHSACLSRPSNESDSGSPASSINSAPDELSTPFGNNERVQICARIPCYQ